MAIRTYKVTLDSKNSIAPEPVFLRQGDKTGAVVIDATLMDNGVPVSLDGLTPMFKANTADGQAVIADSTGFSILDSANGEFTYQVPNALSAVPGKITTAYFSFSDTSGSESTFDVAFVIKKAVDVSQAQADDYITIVDGTLKTLQQKIDAMNTDVQTILDAYNQGNFYNQAQTDSKDAATLTSAQSYADSGDAATLATLTAGKNSTKILTDWTSDGISYKNGCTERADTDKIRYRLIKLGDSKFLSIIGWFDVPALNSGQKIVAFTLPISVTSQVNKYRLSIGRELNNWGGSLTSYDLDPQTGDFFVSNAAAGNTDATGLMVNYGTWA